MKKTNKYYPNFQRDKFYDFADLINSVADKYTDKDCYRFIRNKNEYKISFSEYRDTINAFGVGLREIGAAPGHIAVIGEKCYEWLAAYFASVIYGGVAVPLDKELSEEQIRGFINFADCETVVYTKKYRKVFEGFKDEMPNVKNYIEITLDAPEIPCAEKSPSGIDSFDTTFADVMNFGAAKISERGLPDLSNVDPEVMGIILFTSGTTGTSKGVMLSQRNILTSMDGGLEIIDIRSDDTIVSVLPFHHTYEMTAGIMATYAVGATVCINDNIKNTTRDMKYFKPTMLALVPLFVTTIYKKIMDTAHKKGLDKTLVRLMKTDHVLRKIGIDMRKAFFSQVTSNFGGRLTRIVCGGAPMPPDLLDKFASLGISVAEGYGITECSPVIAVNPFVNARKGSCGLILNNMQIYIDRDSADDETGEIVVKGDNVMLGYYKNEEATRAVLDERGWFRTGDCGYIDEDNFVHITGRQKNVIVLNNGKNVFPEEIEEYLEQIPTIAECVVVGKKSKDDDTINVTALIYPDYDRLAEREGVSGDEAVSDYFKNQIVKLNKKLAGFKQIRNIEIRKTPFPKTTTQKIQRHKIDKE